MHDTGYVKRPPFHPITTPITHNQFLHTSKQTLILLSHRHCHFHRFIIHPFSITHYNTLLVILHASSPSLSFTNHSFILNHSNIRIVASSVAHTHTSNSESLIHHSVLTVIYHAPTIWFVVQHITFPSLSIIIQIQYPIVLNATHLLSIHSQQTTRLSIHFNHSLLIHLHQHRRNHSNPLMIPIHIVTIEQGKMRLCSLLHNVFTHRLILDNASKVHQQFRRTLSLHSLNILHHKGMLFITLSHNYSLPSTHSHSLSLPHLSLNTSSQNCTHWTTLSEEKEVVHSKSLSSIPLHHCNCHTDSFPPPSQSRIHPETTRHSSPQSIQEPCNTADSSPTPNKWDALPIHSHSA